MRRLRVALLASVIFLAACTPAQLAGFIWTNRDPGPGVPCAEWAGAFRIAGFRDGYELQHMLTLVRRESRCDPSAISSTQDAGLAQVHWPAWLGQLCAMGIACTVDDLKNPQANAWAARWVYDHSGWGAWATN